MSEAAARPVCSRAGCRQGARWRVQWRNPKIHSADRVKVWLACDDHRGSLSDFVAKRGFLIEVIAVDQLTDADG